jgi:hypothetical protein
MNQQTLERLEHLRKRNSNRQWVNRDLYRLMYQEDLYILAYERLIPTRVLTSRSEMREKGHRTEPFRGRFQLPEPVTDLVNHVVERWKRQIRKLFFADFFPDMFHGIQFWTIGRLRDQPDILRHRQRFGAMPARAIHLQDHEIVGERVADMLAT